MITTFDLGACRRVYLLILRDPARYAKHIMPSGTFHLIYAYLHLIGKKIHLKSDSTDGMLESGLLGSGTRHYLSRDKNYSPVLMCHKIGVFSLERLLLRGFIDKHGKIKAFENYPDTINGRATTSPPKKSLE